MLYSFIMFLVKFAGGQISKFAFILLRKLRIFKEIKNISCFLGELEIG
jgi:hypothetical protein